MENTEIKIGFIGCGIMGGALIRAFIQTVTPANICISAAHFGNAQTLAQETGCTACKTNAETAALADYVFLAVKPAYAVSVLSEIRTNLKKNATLISMAAGVPLEKLRTAAGRTAVIRIMPNLPALVGEAMTALCCGPEVNPEAVRTVTSLLNTAGKVEKIDEKLMDCVTAVSGSGPAYAFLFIEALADAAVRFGMPRQQAYIYASQTLKGAAEMCLKDGRCPAALKDAVCSPAGTTIEGVTTLEKTGFRTAIIEAATAAYNKSAAMAK